MPLALEIEGGPGAGNEGSFQKLEKEGRNYPQKLPEGT